jgi:hypothetical protein
MRAKGKIFAFVAVVALLYATSQFTRGRAQPAWSSQPEKAITPRSSEVSPATAPQGRAAHGTIKLTHQEQPSPNPGREPDVPPVSNDLITTESLSRPQEPPAKALSPKRRPTSKVAPPPAPAAQLSNAAREPIQFRLADR